MSSGPDTTPAEAEADAEQARAGLVNTLNQLRENLKPANVVDEVMSSAKLNVSAITDQILDTAKKNPLPAVLIGAGLAMIFGFGTRYALPGSSTVAGKVPAEPLPPGERYGAAPTRSLPSRSPPRWSSVSPRTNTVLGTATGKASDLLDTANTKLSDAAARGATVVNTAYANAKRSGPMTWSRQNVGSSINKLVEEQPLVLAAIGVAIGAALGAALPHTDLEDGLMGQTAGNVRDSAQSLAQDQLAQVKSAAAHAVEDIKQTAADHGISSQNLSGLVQDVGSKAKTATYEVGRAADPTT